MQLRINALMEGSLLCEYLYGVTNKTDFTHTTRCFASHNNTVFKGLPDG